MNPWVTWILALVAAGAAFFLGYCQNNPPPPAEEPVPTVCPSPETSPAGNKWLGELEGIFVERGGP